MKGNFLEIKGKAKALREMGWTEELPIEPASPTPSRPPKHAGPSLASPRLLGASQTHQPIKGSPSSSSSWCLAQGFSPMGTAASAWASVPTVGVLSTVCLWLGCWLQMPGTPKADFAKCINMPLTHTSSKQGLAGFEIGSSILSI